MYKDTLLERTFWFTLGALAIWGARYAGCQLLLTQQVIVSINQSIIFNVLGTNRGPTGGQQTIKAYSEYSNNNVYGSGAKHPCFEATCRTPSQNIPLYQPNYKNLLCTFACVQ